MAHLKPRGNFSKAVKGNFRLFETLEKVKMEFRLVEGTIFVKVFVMDRELTTEAIEDCMDSLVSPGGTTVLVLALELGVVVGGEEASFVEERKDLVLDGDDVGLFLVLHAVVAGAVVAEEYCQPVSRH